MNIKELRAQLLIESVHSLADNDVDALNESFIKNVLNRNKKKEEEKKNDKTKADNSLGKHYTNTATVYGIEGSEKGNDACSVYYSTAKDAFDKFFFGKIDHSSNKRIITRDMIKFSDKYERYIFAIKTDDYYVSKDGSIRIHHVIDFKQDLVSVKDAVKYGFKISKGMSKQQRVKLINDISKELINLEKSIISKYGDIIKPGTIKTSINSADEKYKSFINGETDEYFGFDINMNYLCPSKDPIYDKNIQIGNSIIGMIHNKVNMINNKYDNVTISDEWDKYEGHISITEG